VGNGPGGGAFVFHERVGDAQGGAALLRTGRQFRRDVITDPRRGDLRRGERNNSVRQMGSESGFFQEPSLLEKKQTRRGMRRQIEEIS